MISKTLSLQEQVKFKATHLFLITAADLVTRGGANLTYTWAILDAPVGTVCRMVAAKVKTAFAGCATLVLEVGDDGDVDRNLASFDLKSTAGTWKTLNPTTLTNNVFNTANTIDFLFTATTNNLDQLSAGELLVLVDTANLNEIDEA